MEPIPETRWHEKAPGGEPDRTLNIGTTAEGDQSVSYWIDPPGHRRLSFELTADQLAEKITNEIRRLALMRGRRAAVEAVAATVPETRLRGRTEWELTEKAHDALSGAESADASAAGGTGDGERVPLRDRGAKSTTMWTRRNSSSGNFALGRAESAAAPAAGGTTPGTGDETHHGPAGRPEPVDLP